MKSLILLSMVASSMCILTPSFAASVNDYLKTAKVARCGLDSGTNFDFKPSLQSVPGNKIMTITVGYNTLPIPFISLGYITGVKLDYLYGDSVSTGAFNQETKQIDLDFNEYVSSVKLWKGSDVADELENRVVKLQFTIDNDEQITIGNSHQNTKSSCWWASEHVSDRMLYTLHGYTENGILSSLGSYIYNPLELIWQSTEFHVERMTETSPQTTFFSETAGINYSSVGQSITTQVSVEESDSFSNSWSETSGISSTMGITVSASASYAGLAEVSTELSASVTQEESYTVGEEFSESSTSSQSQSVTMNVPAKTIMVAKTTVYYKNGVLPYTMTFKNTWDDNTFEQEGYLENSYVQQSFTSWLEIGYINDAGDAIVYDQYKADFEDMVNPSSLAKNSSEAMIPQNNLQGFEPTKGNSIQEQSNIKLVKIKGIQLDANDPNWILSEEEIAFREQQGF